jgi:hypothetical protein
MAARRPVGRGPGGQHGHRPVRVHADPAADDRAGGLSAQGGAALATANYVGYLVGALAGALPVFRRPVVARASLVVIVVTLAAMPLTHNMVLWLVLRLTAGIASAATFVAAVGVGRSLG